MNKFIAVFVVLLSGCTTAPLPYTPSTTMTIEDAKAFVEQILMEQPEKFRPQSVVFTESFFGTSDGTKTRGKSRGIAIPVGDIAVARGRSEALYKELTTRVYYSSIGDIKRYKGRWNIVDINNTDGHRILRAYTTNEGKALRFIDAVTTLTSAAQKPKPQP